MNWAMTQNPQQPTIGSRTSIAMMPIGVTARAVHLWAPVDAGRGGCGGSCGI
jgi:hypothetical protein